MDKKLMCKSVLNDIEYAKKLIKEADPDTALDFLLNKSLYANKLFLDVVDLQGYLINLFESVYIYGDFEKCLSILDGSVFLINNVLNELKEE